MGGCRCENFEHAACHFFWGGDRNPRAGTEVQRAAQVTGRAKMSDFASLSKAVDQCDNRPPDYSQWVAKIWMQRNAERSARTAETRRAEAEMRKANDEQRSKDAAEHVKRMLQEQAHLSSVFIILSRNTVPANADPGKKEDLQQRRTQYECHMDTLQHLITCLTDTFQSNRGKHLVCFNHSMKTDMFDAAVDALVRARGRESEEPPTSADNYVTIQRLLESIPKNQATCLVHLCQYPPVGGAEERRYRCPRRTFSLLSEGAPKVLRFQNQPDPPGGSTSQ